MQIPCRWKLRIQEKLHSICRAEAGRANKMTVLILSQSNLLPHAASQPDTKPVRLGDGCLFREGAPSLSCTYVHTVAG